MWDVLQADESSEAECKLTISTNICQQQLMKYLRSIPNGTGWDSITMHRAPPHFSQLCLTWGRRVNSLFRGLNKSCCFYHFERKEKPTKIEMETSHPPFPPPHFVSVLRRAAVYTQATYPAYWLFRFPLCGLQMVCLPPKFCLLSYCHRGVPQDSTSVWNRDAIPTSFHWFLFPRKGFQKPRLAWNSLCNNGCRDLLILLPPLLECWN